MSALPCDAEGCVGIAVVALEFRGMPGHVHVCARDEATDREWCDVTLAFALRGRECPYVACTPGAIYTARPVGLEQGCSQ